MTRKVRAELFRDGIRSNQELVFRFISCFPDDIVDLMSFFLCVQLRHLWEVLRSSNLVPKN